MTQRDTCRFGSAVLVGEALERGAPCRISPPRAGAAFFAISMMDRASVSGMRSASIGMGGAVAVPWWCLAALRGEPISGASGAAVAVRSMALSWAGLGWGTAPETTCMTFLEFFSIFLPPRGGLFVGGAVSLTWISPSTGGPAPSYRPRDSPSPRRPTPFRACYLSRGVGARNPPAGGVYGKKANTREATFSTRSFVCASAFWLYIIGD